MTEGDNDRIVASVLIHHTAEDRRLNWPTANLSSAV